MIRWVQTTEYTYWLHKRDAEAAVSSAGVGGKRPLGYDAREILQGKGKAGVDFLIAPELLTYLSVELKEKGEVLKAFRKCNAEREAPR